MPERKRIVIVGGVAGGASAAARARRLSEEASIVLFERGPDISFANCGMPYHIGGAIPNRDRLLVQTPQAMHSRYGIDVRTRSEVVGIDRNDRTVRVRDLTSDREYDEPYDVLILSPGAEPVRPPIEGIDNPGVFSLRTLGDMDRIKAHLDDTSPGRAVVIGGGYIGLEMVEAFVERGVEVSLVELAGQVFVAADPEMVAPVHQVLEARGVDLRLNTSVTAIRRMPDEQLTVVLSDGEEIACGLVMVAVGVRPESRLARQAGLEIGSTGGILVDEHMQTSDPAVYAVGDAIEIRHAVGHHPALIPLAGPANRQGRIAADNAFGRRSFYRGSQGTAICKVFDLAIGMTGLSEKECRRLGRACEKVYVHPASHASYYPGATQLSLKLIFDPASGRVLGAQAVGLDGVDKRIDVIAVAVRAGLTVHDLAEQELSYAPPFGSAKDPVNYAGFVAANIVDGDAAVCHAHELPADAEMPDEILLDVRTPAEVQAGTIPGSINIPLDELRHRVDELPADRPVTVFCQVGLRGYLACRTLRHYGRQCRNLSGGYKTWKAFTHRPGRTPTVVAEAAEMREDTGQMTPDADRRGRPDQPQGDGDRSAANAPPAQQTDATIVRRIDATAMQCPGPIVRLQAELATLDAGQAVAIEAADPGFAQDVQAWCRSTGHRLVTLERENGTTTAVIARQAPAAGPAARPTEGPDPKNKTLVVFSGDFDKAMAAFIIANGAAAMGSRVTMFFTFWGLNILRRPQSVKVRKNLVERMFGWMMPRGPGKLSLSKMHMGGMGTRMIQGIMRKKNVLSLPELIASAQKAGVNLVACQMTMDLMGIRQEELIDGVGEGGVAAYLDAAEAGTFNLFI